jgi:hypothetical protein
MGAKRKLGEAEEHQEAALTKIPTCQRCKIKKIKCDDNCPQCSRCAKNGEDCTIYDPILKREVLRVHSLELEQRIRELELKLSQNGIEIGSKNHIPAISIDNQIENNNNNNNHHHHHHQQPKISFSQLMSTAVKVNTYRKSIPILQNPSIGKRDSTTVGDQSIPIVPAILPPKITALQFLDVFFSQSNSQLPILHREEFFRKYFVPIYGSIEIDQSISFASNFTPINKKYIMIDQKDEEPWFEQYLKKFEIGFQAAEDKSDENIRKISNNIRPPKKYHKALYFLNMIFAIASSVKHLQYPISISASFRFAATKFFDKIYQASDHLETLQGVLLFAVYSTMRPTYPSVWYTLGIALRLCVDLDLHNELNIKNINNLDPFIIDKRRRLFWCTYSLDRQVCFYLNRPNGIHDESINTPFPSNLDDSEILPAEYNHLANKSLNANLPSYKMVTLSILTVRQIQSEVQRILYTNAELPRIYKSLLDWRVHILNRLEIWKNSCPKSVQDMNCDFNLRFFDLNYFHVLLNIYGLSPKNYKLTTEDFIQVSIASQGLIEIYNTLFKAKTINFTWAAVHNLFLAGSSYLYTIYNCEEVRKRNTLPQVLNLTSDCLNVLGSLIDRCEAAKNCGDVFKNLAIVIIKMKYGESVSSILPGVNDDLLNKLDVRANLSISKLFEVLNHENQYLSTNELNEKIWNEVYPIINIDEPSTFGWKTKASDMKDGEIESEFDGPELDAFFKELQSENGSLADSDGSICDNILSSVDGSIESTNYPTQEGRKTYEAMRKMPNEIIWDQFFSSPANIAFNHDGFDPSDY